MPIIKPEVQKVLRSAGLVEEPQAGGDNLSMDEKLSLAGLDGENIAEEITKLALHSNNDALRLRALEMALRVKGALKEQPPTFPTFNIIIQGSNKNLSETEGTNPIIFPRQSLDGAGGTFKKPN